MKNEIVCPLCGKKNYTVYLSQPHRRIVRCQRDGLVFVNPQPTASEITRLYNGNYFATDKARVTTSAGYYNYLAEKPLLLSYFRRKITLLATMLSGKKVLEVGSSYGFFLEEAKRAHLDIQGIDISQEAVAYARRQGLSARAVDLLHTKFPSQSFDGVVAFQLIEHVTDPVVFMSEVYRIMKPGGVVLLATPREGGYLMRFLGSHWSSYRHQGHLYFFSRHTMTLILKKAGFGHIHCFGDEPRWYPVHFLLQGAAHYFENPWLRKTFGWAEKVFRLTPFSYLQVPFPLDTMIVTAKK